MPIFAPLFNIGYLKKKTIFKYKFYEKAFTIFDDSLQHFRCKS